MCMVQFIPRPSEPISPLHPFHFSHVQDALVVTCLQAFFIRPRRRFLLLDLRSCGSCQHEQQLCDRPWSFFFFFFYKSEKKNVGKKASRSKAAHNTRAEEGSVIKGGWISWASLCACCVKAKFFSASVVITLLSRRLKFRRTKVAKHDKKEKFTDSFKFLVSSWLVDSSRHFTWLILLEFSGRRRPLLPFLFLSWYFCLSLLLFYTHTHTKVVSVCCWQTAAHTLLALAVHARVWVWGALTDSVWVCDRGCQRGVREMCLVSHSADLISGRTVHSGPAVAPYITPRCHSHTGLKGSASLCMHTHAHTHIHTHTCTQSLTPTQQGVS